MRVALVAIGEEHGRDLLGTLGVQLGRVGEIRRSVDLALRLEPQREGVEPSPEGGIRGSDVIVHSDQCTAGPPPLLPARYSSRCRPGGRWSGWLGAGPATIPGILRFTGAPCATVNAFPWCDSDSGSPAATV